MKERPKPWWKRKRWIATGLLWLLLAYPLSVGPVAYAMTRGWYLPGTELEVVYAPLISIGRNPERYGVTSRSFRAYVHSFEKIARKHNGERHSRPEPIGISGLLLMLATTSGSLAVVLFVVQRKRRAAHEALDSKEARLL